MRSSARTKKNEKATYPKTQDKLLNNSKIINPKHLHIPYH